jgi:hypothetical protein
LVLFFLKYARRLVLGWLNVVPRYLQLKTSLCNNIIVAGTIQVTLIAQYIKSQLVALKSNIELCLAQLTRSGAINETRSYECTTQSWTGWTTTSNNCTPDPPTCVLNLLKRGQLTCQAGFEGLSTRAKNFNMFRSVWFSNLDCTWSTIYRYLQDDSDKLKQSGIANQSDKSFESKQRDEPSHHCAHHSTQNL